MVVYMDYRHQVSFFCFYQKQKITRDLWRKPRVEVEEKDEKRQEEMDARV